MVLAIVLGALSGVLGFFPLIVGSNLARKATATSNLSHATALLLGVGLSMIFMAVVLVVCIVFARDLVLPFALALVVALTVTAIAYGAYGFLRK